MKLKERLEIEGKTHSFGKQNEYRAFKSGADFAIKAVIEMLEERKDKYYEKYSNGEITDDARISFDCSVAVVELIIRQLKSEI